MIPIGGAGASEAPASHAGAARLDDPVQYVPGVGPQGAALLGKLQITTVAQLLRHFPRRWEDRTQFRHVAEAVPGEQVNLCGTVLAVNQTYPRPNLPITRVLLDDTGSALTLVWFNQPYLEKTFRQLAATRRSVAVFGCVRRSGWALEIHNPEWEELGEGDRLSTNRIVPIYPLTEGLRQSRMRRILDAALEIYLRAVQETLPPDTILHYQLIGVQKALANIHFPESAALRDAARKRLIFEELFLLQTFLARRRRLRNQEERGLRFHYDAARLEADLQEIVPFSLTRAQRRAIAEIARDASSGQPMNRLLQGDVGSGKTLVALAAMFLAVENGYQAALMAPTEILAQQHAIVLRRLLEPMGMAVELAHGSQPARQKAGVRERLISGQSRLAVGTHALIQESVEFARLGLVVIDEQHRFGVLERQALQKKGERPHVLVMTATPIPRTLTLTLYGDLEVSVLDELPPGRKPITTHWRTLDRRMQVYRGAQKLLDEGRQIYVVCPLVEESEKLQARSAIQLHEQIASEIYPQYRIGLLHGQMKAEEKDDVMARFKAHALDVLVATTVIEVGIDVPNASAILIEDADRFGLAQLHQLRGRVGRGEHASYCVLLATPKTDDGKARLEILTRTQDGFRIAEEDLRLRGPGEFYGIRQSGLPPLYIADIVRDIDVLAETRRAAFALVESDPELMRPEHRPLRRALEQNRPGFELIHVG